MLFEQDGTPKYDFRISDRFRKKVSLALKHPHQDTKTGKTYYGEIWTSGYHKRAYPNEYLIQVTPTFLSDEELKSIPFGLIKRIGNVEIELVPPLLQDNVSFPDIVKEYIDGILIYEAEYVNGKRKHTLKLYYNGRIVFERK